MTPVYVVALSADGAVIVGEAVGRNATRVSIRPFDGAATVQVDRWRCSFFLKRNEAERYAREHTEVANA